MARIEGIPTGFENEVMVDNAHLEEPFTGDITQGNICHFIPGFFFFSHETRLAVATILTFMQDVRVVIAIHPMDYHVFYRSV